MQYILDAKGSQEVDTFSIMEIGIPSVILMERAALAVCEQILMHYQGGRILCVCGSGNNGADGLAVARQLSEKEIPVCVILAAGFQKKGTEEYELQKSIAGKLHLDIIEDALKQDWGSFEIIVDALFGIGLSRELSGVYADIVNKINLAHTKVIAVDIPTGINASNGACMGVCVKADITVTFGYLKAGLVLYPGASYAGDVIVSDIGFAKDALDQIIGKMFTYDEIDLRRIPKRRTDGNKGTFGKALIVAGSKGMGGAAIFSGKAAYRCGCGLVKLLTHQELHEGILQHLPEALLSLYQGDESEEEIRAFVKKAVQWADCIVAGPGLSTDEMAVELVRQLLDCTKVPLLLDADGLNIIAKHMPTGYGRNRQIIITPHVGEMSRLCGKSIEEIKGSLVETAKEYALREQVICVLKDARTIVTDGSRVYVNMSGSDAMATGGSGDVLTGVIIGMVAAGMGLFDAAVMGCFVHGRAGELAGLEMGSRAVMASDIADYVGIVLK